MGILGGILGGVGGAYFGGPMGAGAGYELGKEILPFKQGGSVGYAPRQKKKGWDIFGEEYEYDDSDPLIAFKKGGRVKRSKRSGRFVKRK
jgi:hypothetical protein